MIRLAVHPENLSFSFDSQDVELKHETDTRNSKEILNEISQISELKKNKLIAIDRLLSKLPSASYVLTGYKNALLAEDIFKEIMEDHEHQLAQMIGEIYFEFSRMYYQSDHSGEKKEEQSQLVGDTGVIDNVGRSVSVEVKVLGKTVVVKTPFLLSKNMSKSKKKNGEQHYLTMRLFREEVYHELKKMQSVLPSFESKNIAVLAVYDENKVFVPDNDNIESKSIVDAITSFFGGDNAFTCSFYLSSIRSKSISPGTYFIVTDNMSSPPEQSNLTQIVELLFKN